MYVYVRVSDPLEMELQIAVNWTPGIEPMSFGRAASTLNHWPISPALLSQLFKPLIFCCFLSHGLSTYKRLALNLLCSQVSLKLVILLFCFLNAWITSTYHYARLDVRLLTKESVLGSSWAVCRENSCLVEKYLYLLSGALSHISSVCLSVCQYNGLWLTPKVS